MISNRLINIHNTKRHLVSLAGALLITLSVLAQTNKDVPVAIATTRGIWIYLGHEIPKKFDYQVLRKQGNGDFKIIGTTNFNNDIGILKSRTDMYNKFFPDLDRFGENELLKLREFAAKSNNTDSMVMTNFPVSHLALGTAFFDSDVKEGVPYQYQVKKLSTSKTTLNEGISNSIQLPAKTEIMKPLYKQKEELSNQVVLQWYVNEQRKLNTFTVYRRVFGLGDYERIAARRGFITIHDTLCLIMVDTSAKSPGYYEYFLQTLDIYGNPGPKSDVISAGPKADASLSIPMLFKAKGCDKEHEIKLSWILNNHKYLRGIEIFRSTSFDTGYHKIALVPATDTSYFDHVPKANENYYYYLVIIRPFDKSLPSAKVSAMFINEGGKPDPPSEVAAETIKGGVKIHWSDQDSYLKGFFVFRYIYSKAEYEQISGLIPVKEGYLYDYTDSSKAIVGNETYRYALKAVNDVGQLSDISSSASAKPGKKAYVVTPMNIKINEQGNRVLLIWDDSRKAEPNLLGYKIYRREGAEKKFQLLPSDTLKREKNYFVDSTLTAGKSYTYAISAIDFYGNESARSLSAYYTCKATIILPPDIIRAINTHEGIMIVLGQLTDKNVAAYKLYRTSSEGKPLLIATIEPGNEQYLDKNVVDGQLYIYEITTYTRKGDESEKSKSISVRRKDTKSDK